MNNSFLLREFCIFLNLVIVWHTWLYLRHHSSLLGTSPGDDWKINQFPCSFSLFTRPSKDSSDNSNVERFDLLCP